MESQQYAEFFNSITGISILILIVLWAILTFFLPFMVYAIMRTNKELVQLNKKILAELQGKQSIRTPKHVEPDL